jgi:GNAT superfamily N-acetyltransferase
MMKITLEQTPKDEDTTVIGVGLRNYNLQHAPATGYQSLTLVLRDPDQAVVGGLLGETYWGWLHIDILWLDERVRRKGYGSEILAMAEQEAVQRGCGHAFLDTLSFQALPFYQKAGYVVFGVLDDFPTGHKRYYLQKALEFPPLDE